MIERRQFLISSAALACGLGSGAAFAQPDAMTTLRISLIPILDIAPFHAALKQGYFKEAGLVLDGSPSQGGAAGIPALLSGAFQIAFSNVVSILQGVERGFPLKIIAPAMETMGDAPDSAGIVALKASTIKSGADLKGKRVAVNTRNNIIWLYARHWIDHTGGNSTAVNFVEVPFPQMPDALIRGQVDAAMVSQPYLGALLQNPDAALVGWPYSFEGMKTATSFYVATSEQIAKDPASISKFTDALKKGIAWSNENYHKPAFAELVSDYTKIPIDRLTPIFATPFQYRTESDVASIETTRRLMTKYGLLTPKLDVPGLLHPSK